MTGTGDAAPDGVGSIRTAGEGDVGAVVDLSLRASAPVFASFEETWGQTLYERFWPDWHTQQATAVRKAVAANPTWVSTDEDRITGFVNVIFDESELAGEISMIAVDPSDPGHGPARRTYERAGFLPIHQVLYARLL